ncbi:hypothetical protein SDC9_60570 [bioreactor metagenome]|uniref:Uncharacterized protein n=1 Tax=bioreactor metagenome TaxID=1076179 RepID=A0A644XDA9_9ZZZZ
MLIYIAPKQYSTIIPINTVTNRYLLKLLFFPFKLLINGAITKKPNINPPVGPNNLPNPLVPPEKIGNPKTPKNIYTKTTKNDCLGVSIKATKLIAIVCAVIIVGVNGSGKEIYADIQIIAIQIDIFVNSFIFILIPHFYLFCKITLKYTY